LPGWAALVAGPAERATIIALRVLPGATEAGARNLISTGAATSHLVHTFGEIINSLAAEAKSLMAASM
jgi:hypothetical protein